jgi:hypothetical protein
LAFESEKIRKRHHYWKLELEGWTYGMKANGAMIEIERHEEPALDGSARNNRVRAAEGSFSGRTKRDYAAESERGAVTVNARALSAPPVLLMIASYLGAVCVGAWASLNLLHWFWRQLQ